MALRRLSSVSPGVFHNRGPSSDRLVASTVDKNSFSQHSHARTFHRERRVLTADGLVALALKRGTVQAVRAMNFLEGFVSLVIVPFRFEI